MILAVILLSIVVAGIFYIAISTSSRQRRAAAARSGRQGPPDLAAAALGSDGGGQMACCSRVTPGLVNPCVAGQCCQYIQRDLPALPPRPLPRRHRAAGPGPLAGRPQCRLRPTVLVCA